MLFRKAAEIDLAAYDNPGFYSDFILAIENIREFINRTYWRDNINNILGLVLVTGILISIDPAVIISLVISSAISVPLCKKIGLMIADKRRDMSDIRRRANYFFRLFYQPEYAGEVRTTGVSPLLFERYSEMQDKTVGTRLRYDIKISTLNFFNNIFANTMMFTVAVGLWLCYRITVSGTLSSGDFVATFNGIAIISSIVT